MIPITYLDKLKIRKIKDKYVIFVKSGLKTQEIFIRNIYIEGGTSSNVLVFTKTEDIAKIIKDPVRVLANDSLNRTLLSTRVLYQDFGTFWRWFRSDRDYTCAEFIELYPECFI